MSSSLSVLSASSSLPVGCLEEDFVFVDPEAEINDFVILIGEMDSSDSTEAPYSKPLPTTSVGRYLATTFSWLSSQIRLKSRAMAALGVELDPRHTRYKELDFLLNWTGYPMSTFVGTSYADWLVAKGGHVLREGLHNQEEIEGRSPLSQLERGLEDYGREKPLFIPFVFPRHVVVFTIDFQAKQVQYYDSLAIAAASRVPYTDCNLRDQLEAMKERAFPGDDEVEILENNYPHQQDCHSCGIFAMTFIKRRVQGECFDKVIQTMGPVEALRDQMARDLF